MCVPHTSPQLLFTHEQHRLYYAVLNHPHLGIMAASAVATYMGGKITEKALERVLVSGQLDLIEQIAQELGVSLPE